MSVAHGKRPTASERTPRRKLKSRPTRIPHRSEFVDEATGEVTRIYVWVDSAVLSSPAFAGMSHTARSVYPYLVQQFTKHGFAHGDYREPKPVPFAVGNLKKAGVHMDRKTLASVMDEHEAAGLITQSKPSRGKPRRFLLVDEWRKVKRLPTKKEQPADGLPKWNFGKKSVPKPAEEIRSVSILNTAYEGLQSLPSEENIQSVVSDPHSPACGAGVASIVTPQQQSEVSLPFIRGRVAFWLKEADEQPLPDTIAAVAAWVEKYPGGFAHAEQIAQEIIKEVRFGGRGVYFCGLFAKKLGIQE